MAELYSTGCPKCNVLKKKLDNANIAYNLNTTFNAEELVAQGYDEVPLLKIDDKILRFSEAVDWVNLQGKGTK